jgi:hypothetical protein
MVFNMKKLHLLIIVLGLFVSTNTLFGQAKKPTIMILPSDNWCTQRYFMTEFDNQGTKQKVPNYKQAFQEDTELGQVISEIGSLMIDRGFPLKDAEQELKTIEARNAEDNMTSSKTSGSSISENPLDILKKRAKADIIIQIWWKVNKVDDQKSVSFILEAFDAYTSKRIASSTGSCTPSNEIIPVQLEKAILANIDPFSAQLQSHYDNMLTIGREIVLTIKLWDNWENDLETEFNGEELTDIIDDWMAKNTVSGRYNMTDATQNIIRFEQVRIPMYNDKERAIDARGFAKELRKFLKADPYLIESKLMTRGLGEAIIVLGEK